MINENIERRSLMDVRDEKMMMNDDVVMVGGRWREYN